MAKLVLGDLPSGFNRSRIDSNFTKIKQEFQDILTTRQSSSKVTTGLAGLYLVNARVVID